MAKPEYLDWLCHDLKMMKADAPEAERPEKPPKPEQPPKATRRMRSKFARGFDHYVYRRQTKKYGKWHLRDVVRHVAARSWGKMTWIEKQPFVIAGAGPGYVKRHNSTCQFLRARIASAEDLPVVPA